ncbi:PERM1 protein, partial [Struthidea cinerea]|nr:PERM1 protein [Struthidea cinerea]
MDNFEYSIQLNDREWAEFFQASEECSLAPASLATAEEQCLSDIEQGDASGRDCPCSTAGLTAAGPGSEPAAGTGSPAPRGVAGATAPRCPEPGHLSPPELLSGGEDEAEPGSVGRLLCDSDEPRCLSPGGSPSVVRPKVPAQPRKSRRQRGASAAEGDRDPAGAAAPGAAGAGKAPPGSPMSPRKGRGKEKAAKGALVRLGSEEAADSKRSVPGPGLDGGDPGTAAPKQRGKEPGPQSPGKTKAAKHPKAGQAGGSGVRDSVPVVPGDGAAAAPRQACQEMPGKPLQPGSAAAFGGNAAEGAAEIPREMSPLCFADGASAKPNSLDVTWPEMYDYLFCDSQEEEELGSSVEGRKSPLQREFSWPELYEYFFNEPEGSRKKGKAKDRKRKKFSGLDRAGLQKEGPSPAPGKDTVVIPVPDVYGHFFPERAWSRMGWRGIFSMASPSEVKKAVGALKSLLQRQIQRGRGQAPTSRALVPRGSGEKLALVPLGGAQVWPGDADTALALRGAAEDPRVLSHKDMCLVFCAFASWAVKTSDLQAPDAWKTMFLASFGTLSAIRYFRRQVREGHPRT